MKAQQSDSADRHGVELSRESCASRWMCCLLSHARVGEQSHVHPTTQQPGSPFTTAGLSLHNSIHVTPLRPLPPARRTHTPAPPLRAAGSGGSGSNPAALILASACISRALRMRRSAVIAATSAVDSSTRLFSFVSWASSLVAAAAADAACFSCRSWADFASSSWFSSPTFSAASDC